MESNSPSKDWFAVWFDSHHYHQLYGHRSDAEAKAFMERLHMEWGTGNLQLLDLACGRGRHARAAAELGHEVLGLDLSQNSIEEAQHRHAGVPGLSFVVGDMRHFELERSFDGVLNLFTSFGYFDRKADHLAVLRQVHRHLRPGGFLVLDFLDTPFAKACLVPKDEITRDGVTYRMERHVERQPGADWDTFVKRIVHDGPEGRGEHVERVAALNEEDLTDMLESSGFNIVTRYGDYTLAPWKAGKTPRIIYFATA